MEPADGLGEVAAGSTPPIHAKEHAMRDELRCQQCGDLIGVYEPMIRMAETGPQETSRAAHPDPGAAGVECFHASCFRSRAASDDVP